MSNHTPGPWEVDEVFCIVRRSDWKPKTVCVMKLHGSPKTGEPTLEDYANSRLIAAAPELLEALKAVKALAVPMATHIHAVCDGAIAKAEGHQ